MSVESASTTESLPTDGSRVTTPRVTAAPRVRVDWLEDPRAHIVGASGDGFSTSRPTLGLIPSRRLHFERGEFGHAS